MKFKINLDMPFTTVGGDVIEGDSVGKILSTLLANSISSKEYDSVKLFSMATEIYKSGSLTLDTSDKKTLETFVGGVTTISNLMKAQILTALDKAEPLGD